MGDGSGCGDENKKSEMDRRVVQQAVAVAVTRVSRQLQRAFPPSPIRNAIRIGAAQQRSASHPAAASSACRVSAARGGRSSPVLVAAAHFLVLHTATRTRVHLAVRCAHRHRAAAAIHSGRGTKESGRSAVFFFFFVRVIKLPS